MINKIFISAILIWILIGCTSDPNKYADNLVVIDAGHGGHDTGATRAGFYEKDLVLKIAQKTAKEFEAKGYSVYLTRNSDRFISLSGRTKIADRKDAKLFISIHANAIANKERFNIVEGIETYYLQKTRDEKSQRIAMRENSSVLQDADELSKNVIIDSVLNGPKIIESNKLAIDIQSHMLANIKEKYFDVKNGGVIPAPFYVLVGASRPSILVEVGYITNDKERSRLFTQDYQNRIAKGIVAGASRYIDNHKKEMGF